MGKEKYVITFNSNGGSTVASINKDYGETVEAPENPVKEGYAFTGWYIDEGLISKYTFGKMPAKNITLYAGWKVNTYNVEFKDSELEPIKVEYGEKIVRPNNPYKEGYTFINWYKDEGRTITYNFDEKVYADVTLYASWKVNKYTVTYNTNGGNSIEKSEVEYGSIVPRPTDPEKEGYTFIGWQTIEGETYNFGVMPSENITIYASWKANRYRISFESNGGSEVSPIEGMFGEEIEAPDIPEKDDYKFAGWYKDEQLTNLYSFSVMPSENITLYAKWTKDENVIRYVMGGGENNPSNPTTYVKGVEIELNNPEREGYTFGGWYIDENLTNKIEKITKSMNGDITLYAKWIANKYTITFDTNGGSEVENIEIEYEDIIKNLPTPAKIGYRFTGWYIDEALTERLKPEAEIMGNMKLYAGWEEGLYTVTYESNGGSHVNTVTINGIDVLAKPNDPYKEGYKFAGWYKDVGLTELYTFDRNVEMDMTLYAKWISNDLHTISYELDGGINDPSNPTEYITGEEKEIKSPTKEGYVFVGWYTDSEYKNVITKISNDMNKDITLYAKWTSPGQIVNVPITDSNVSVIIITTALLLIGAAAGAYYHIFKKKNTKK